MTAEREPYPIVWIDEYVSALRDYVVVREEDSLLIKVPNEAHKLNASGVPVLKRLLEGESVLDLWASYGRSESVRRDLYEFFIGLKQVLVGCVNERHPPKAVETRPFSLDFNTLPILSEVALTYRCNLSCRFCYAACSCGKNPDAGPEMSTAEVCRTLRIIREEAQVPSVSFTGGEPALRQDLVELVAYARSDLGLRVNLITNATLVDDVLAGRLKDAGLNSAQVSLESPDERIHDALTEARGSYSRTLAGLECLRREGVIVHTNTTLNRMNMDTAHTMPAFVRKLGLERFSMNMIIPVGASCETRVANAGEDLTLRYAEMSKLIISIQNEAENNGVEFMWYSPTPVCIFNPVPRGLGNKGCAACDGLLSISPSGDVLPCSSWPEPVGNLLRDDFRRVWDSARAQWLRTKAFAPRLCRSCGDFALCQGACPLYWRHFGFCELEDYGDRYAAANG